ncbi:Cytochrome c-type biogenesis protein CcsA/ResC [Candidatus Glomeribacter gigasporarum BEG34]|uniref:Cytochrome c-type biogenesis protein CcsA/ResC n=1 Tax=Candidatus Glomeribacter gigasporarum BEG34 TaxID=1070319 RepID=G2J7L3_9BURK|nr:c-type cytochrome biogenesis protein CcsB [Candidatus Glomeribacter gigasporarum]CCD28758.1 Cytochrome c-type biogenesis protein CcsA/ResC [Candidatus Glomeribacter gigasporarum BEG34]
MKTVIALMRARFSRFTPFDGVYAFALAAGALFLLTRYHAAMDGYERLILIGAAFALGALGMRWKPVRALISAVAMLSLLAITLYRGDLARAEQVFLLKYALSSQSAILWMSALFAFSTIFYWIGVCARAPLGFNLGMRLCWSAVLMGATGMMARWYESYLIGADVGHIPISNLYEVFILFCLITALFYLYYEAHYQTHALGAFALLLISAAVGFLIWYSATRDAHLIQPLVPALQSWWMKIHVPANFIGYAGFALAAMAAAARLLAQRGLWTSRLPALDVLDDLMYKAIAAGFSFFTLATILGALWAADAWGGYWSWDPKESWALIVWLNYAAWLHMRLIKGLRGALAAWWALAGLLVTLFAFLGVNMFLSGLHSYGQL